MRHASPDSSADFFRHFFHTWSRWWTIGLLSCLMTVQSAMSASFDCTKASTKVESLICADAELSKLDDEMSAAYKTALQDDKQADSIRQTQKKWVKERNACSETACVKRSYETRLLTLSATDTNTDDHIAATHPDQVNAEARTSSHVEEACLAPKIDWRNYEWTLITGRGLPPCEEMLAYVKSRPHDVAPPTCPEERLPQNGNWTRPESRILSEAEKQVLLRDIPERFRQKKLGGPVSYELQIADSKLLRVIRGDITRDGIPESFLAFTSNDYRQFCERSKRCARPEAIFMGGVVLLSDAYNLLPMNDAGTQVNWSHRTVYPMQLMSGELIFYKGLPYWMSGVNWSQKRQDNFAHNRTRADDPYSAIFTLSEIGVGTGNTKKGDAPSFKDVTVVAIEHDPESNNVCRLGYFHRNNLKQNPTKTRR